MDRTRWQRATELFGAALERETSSRAPFLEEECREDSALRLEVVAQLEAHKAAGSFLDPGVRRDTLQAADDLLGTQVGRIRLVERLGRGGMGELYLGFDEKLERRVAVKAIRGEQRLDPETRSRFLREARLLSQLQHPHICQIHDYLEGEEADFLVLELIDGRTLSEATEESLPRSLKMKVAEQLVEVLVAAHQRGIIHRDLKPTNVMLTSENAVKVLDFGLARSLDADSGVARAGDPTVAGETGQEANESAVPGTRLGSVLGTVEYMSPEQARGEMATAASDMYSLGLILQELFTGELPYEPDLSPAEQLERARRGESRGLEGGDAHLTRWINRLKSYAPGARPSAQDTAERLRWIRERPRRRILKLLVATAVVASLVVAAVVGFQAHRISEEAKRANQEAQAAQQVSDFLVEIFEVSDPGQARGQTISARELLARGAERITRELSRQPLIQARLMLTLSQIHRRVGLYEEAVTLAEDALDRRRRWLGQTHPDVAAVLDQLGLLYAAQGRHAEAEDCYRRASVIWLQTRGPEHPSVAANLSGLGSLFVAQGKYDEAEELFLRSLAIRERALGPQDRTVAESYNNLARVHADRGEYAAAEPLYRAALELWKESLGEDHPNVGASLNNLANLCADQGRYGEAAELYEETLAIRERVLGPDHPDVATTLNNFATIQMENGEYASAKELYRRALKIREEALGSEHPHVATTLFNLANVYADEKRYVEAEALYRRALAIREKAFGPHHRRVASSLTNLALIYSEQEEYGEAEELFRRALVVWEEAVGSDHPRVADPLHGLANVYRGQGRYADAEPLYRRALSLREQAMEPTHPGVVAIRQDFAILLRELGRSAEAEALEAPAIPDPRPQPTN